MKAMSNKEKRKIATFNKVMTLGEAEREKQRSTSLGKSLKKADKEYEKDRRKE